MRWFLALILVGLSAAGCKSQAPVCDPFFGRTTIPPPATGSVTGRPADPCYQPPPLVPAPSRAPVGVSPPTVQMPCQSSAQAPPSLPQGAAQPLTPQPLAPPAMTTQPASPTQPGSPSGLTPNVLAPRPTSTGGSVAPRSSPPAPSSTPSWAPSPNVLRPAPSPALRQPFATGRQQSLHTAWRQFQLPAELRRRARCRPLRHSRARVRLRRR